jgi:hypothetical protein
MRQTAEGQRGSHQLQETAAADWVLEFGGLIGEFPVEHFLELRGVRDLFEAAPIPRTMRLFQLPPQPTEVTSAVQIFFKIHR